jgi:peptidoglycan/LPS O-acetylase OafA/YrhL
MAKGQKQFSLSIPSEYHRYRGESPSTFDICEEQDCLFCSKHGITPGKFQSTPPCAFYASIAFIKFNLQALVSALVPSFLWRTNTITETKPELYPTAYLDGLRGLAALIVFLHHFILDWFPSLRAGYGSYNGNYHVLQFPVIRIFYSGRGMVAVFFIISGYVLSIKSLRLMRQLQFSELLDSLASSMFRRGIRLFLPPTISTFLSMLFCYAGWYVQDAMNYNIIPVRAASFLEQLYEWWQHITIMTNPFQNIDGRHLYVSPYDSHLWTIPIEFHGTVVVFVTMLTLSKMRSKLRVASLIGAVLYVLWLNRWDLFLFLSGTLFAELSLLISLPSDTSFSSLTRISHLLSTKSTALIFRLILAFTFLTSLYLLSFPDKGAHTSYGYTSLIESYTPASIFAAGLTQRFWLAIGAFLLVLSLVLCPTLQSPFTAPFAQYLGRISYALYLVHGPILYTLGMGILVGRRPRYQPVSAEDRLEAPQHFWGDVVDGWTYGMWFAATGAVNTITCFWAADLFWRVVDIKSVRFAKWLEKHI